MVGGRLPTVRLSVREAIIGRAVLIAPFKTLVPQMLLVLTSNLASSAAAPGPGHIARRPQGRVAANWRESLI